MLVFNISETETFKEWLRYRYGVFPETGFEGDRVYPSHYDFGGETRDSFGCENIAPSSSRNSKTVTETRNRKSFNSEYTYDVAQTVSHVTVPFLPNDDTNGDEPNLKLEEFASTSFKVSSFILINSHKRISGIPGLYIYIYIYIYSVYSNIYVTCIRVVFPSMN